MLETVRGIINERWKMQPNGFIISTKRIANKIRDTHGLRIVGWAGYDNLNSYWYIAKALEELGGVYFGKSSQSAANKTDRLYAAASMWQFTEDRK